MKHSQNIIDFQKKMKNSFFFRLILWKILPLSLFTRVKVIDLTTSFAKLTIPFTRFNKNPFKTTYWASMGIAAEMASGLLLLMYTNKLSPSVSSFVLGTNARFIKRAIGRTYYVCNDGELIKASIEKAISMNESQEIHCLTQVFNDSDELVAEFTFTWGVKARIN